MNHRTLHKIFAAVVLFISTLFFFLTVQPSVSFWDCGEFIASSYYLQVPHPPGAPFFLMLGRIFTMLPFAENIAFRANIISVLSSGLSVLFLYLIAVKLIENYRGKPAGIKDALITYLAAAIGALSFSFSDTFWFNGVEAEVYAFSTFLFGGVTWLMMCWHEKADQKDNEKYLLMIAYLIGVATGVHLMSVLAVVPVVMIIIFRKYVDNEEALKKTAVIFLAHVGVILLIAVIMWADQKTPAPPSPEEYQAYDTKFKIIIAAISAVIMGTFWRKIFTRNSFYLPLIVGGIILFVTYPGIVKFVPTVMSEIAGNNDMIGIVLLLLLFGALGFGVHYSVKEKKPTLHLVFMSFIFIFIGFTSFAMVIIRANQNPPMNENEPDTFTELVSYLNREQYGDFPTFKRRFASEPHQQVVYSGYSSDLDFFWRYQMNHMMTRYWLWNYAGRKDWVQESGPNISPFNKIGNFFGAPFNVHFGGETKDSLYGIPFLIGLIGIYFHFRKDWKMASVFMLMFILMGYLTAFYQNQQQPQPRERDYFYVGAFFVFSIWIAIGMIGIIDYLRLKVKGELLKNLSVFGVLAFGIGFIPVNMIQTNYFTHDRSRNWVPWDYSYNLLQSCAPNSVLFTNGDNDTFPLWYLQDVEKVRRDVKIVNLSLLNTPWYIRQLKDNDPYHVGKVKMKLTDLQIDQIRPIQWEARNINIPLPKNQTKEIIKDLFQQYDISDSALSSSQGISFKMNPTLNFGNVKAIRVQDMMVKEIVESNLWERPIAFAVTCSEDSKIGLQDYLKMEAMAFRIVPQKRKPNEDFINEKILREHLFTKGPHFSQNYKPGFNFRGLNDSTIFFDENHSRMVQNYRNSFIRLALYYINKNQDKLALHSLDTMEEKIPRKHLEMELGLLFEIANLYNTAGGTKQYAQIAEEVEGAALQKIEENPTDVQSYYNPYRILIETYGNRHEYGKLADLWQKLGVMFPQDKNVQENIKKYKNLAEQNNFPDTVSKPVQ